MTPRTKNSVKWGSKKPKPALMRLVLNCNKPLILDTYRGMVRRRVYARQDKKTIKNGYYNFIQEKGVFQKTIHSAIPSERF